MSGIVKQLFAILMLIPWFAGAAELRPIEFLNQFGAAATPPADQPSYRQLTEFMSHARPGGTLKLSFAESFVSIFPTAIRGGDFRPRAPLASPYLYESLWTTDPRQDEYSIYPLMTRAVRASADYCHLSIDLRDDVWFGDGRRVTARDVRFSLETFVNEFFSGAMAELIHHSWGRPVFTERGELGFDVTFTELPPTQCRQGAYYFLSGTPIITPNPAARPGDVVERPYLGSGPYAVAHAERALLRYARDPKYWGRDHERRAHLFNPEVIEVRVFVDPIVERFALLRDDVNLLRETRFTYDAWMKQQTARRPIDFIDQRADDLAGESGAVFMNQKHAHTGDPNFRRALILAWDLETASREFYGGRRHAVASPGGDSALHPRGAPTPEVLALLGRAGASPELADAVGPAEDLTYARLARPVGERARLRLALDWLNRGGYHLARVDGATKLVKNGLPVEITAITRLGSPELRLFLRFQKQLRKLGITLHIREFGDRTALVAALQANQYDLFPSEIGVPRNFNVLNTGWLIPELHSSSADNLAAWGRVRSPLLDVTLDALEKTSPEESGYPAAVDAFLRAFNANAPILPSGEVEVVRSYHRRDLHLWPNRDRDLWTLYFDSAH